MENIFRQKDTAKSSEPMNNLKVKRQTNPEVKNLTKSFLEKMKSLSQVQKINLIYSNLVDKKPDPNLDIAKKLNRILFEQKFGKEIKHTKKFLKGRKKFRFLSKWKSVLRVGTKKGRQVAVWYLNEKGVIEPPKLHPIYSSNMIIIRNSPHEVDPRAFWRMGKYQCLLIKGIDRRAVSNLDYDEIKKRGDATDSDEFIIRAAMQAVIGKPKTPPVNKTTMIIIGVIVIAAIIYFLSS